MPAVKHIWFDFSYTIAFPDEESHSKLLYETYASAVGKPVTPALIEEYKALLEKHLSNSGVFTALGLDAGYWSRHFNTVGLKLGSPTIPRVLDTLCSIVPISLWSNLRVREMLSPLGIDPGWFTNILGPDEVKEPKPALSGFKLVIERSALPSENILFVGDSVEKEVRPAKSLGIQTGLMWDASPEADYSFKSFEEILDIVKP